MSKPCAKSATPEAEGATRFASDIWDTPGARPLKRVIQKAVQDPLAEMILAGDVGDGETVALSAGPAGLTVNGKAVARGEAANDEPEIGAVVPFTKGADSLH